jgi:hypothetical protein
MKMDAATTVVILIWMVIVLTALWMAYDARRYRISSTARPYNVNNGALAAGLSGIVVFFGAQFLLGIWIASGAWLVIFVNYIARRTKVLTAGPRLEPAIVAGPPLPPLPTKSIAVPPTIPAPAEPPSSTPVPPASKPGFVKGVCENCGGHLEFSVAMIGKTITCPHCKGQTTLADGLGSGSATAKPKDRPLPKGIPLGRQSASAADPSGGGQPTRKTGGG